MISCIISVIAKIKPHAHHDTLLRVRKIITILVPLFPRSLLGTPGSMAHHLGATEDGKKETPAFLGCVQTHTTTPNIVGATMLGVVACVLAVVCKRMQQLPTMLGPVEHRGRIQPISLCKPCVMSVSGSNNVGRAVQTDPTLFRYASAITEKRNVGSCWKKSLTGFKLCATTRHNIQQHTTGCANGCNM